MAQYFHTFQMAIPGDFIAPAGATGYIDYTAITALRSLGWSEPFYAQKVNCITASLTETVTISGDPRPWINEFELQIYWEVKDAIASVRLDIKEKNFPFTEQDCKNKANAIEEKIGKFAETWASNANLKDSKGAQWATNEELTAAGLIDTDYGAGNLLITEMDDLKMRLCEQESNKHTLVIGPTGSGKSNLETQNLIRRWQRSALVTEATGSGGRADLFCRTAGFRKHMGHEIYYFNPDDLRSHRINPLEHIQTHRDVRRTAEIIMQSTTKSSHTGDQTWELAEGLLLRALIYHALTKKEDNLCNLAYVHDLLFTGTEDLTQTITNSNSLLARQIYSSFQRSDTEKFTSLVMQGLAIRLSIWSEPRIRALTEVTDVYVDELKDDLFTWYLAVPADKIELKPLAALVFNVAFELVTKAKCKHGLAMFLDELGNFGYVAGLPQKLTILRHDKIPVVLAIQDFIQLELLYGKEWVLFLSQTGCKIHFRPNDLRTAELISASLGTAEEAHLTVTSSGHFDERQEKKPLYSVDEILKLPDGNMIVFTSRTGPFVVKAAHWSLFTDYERKYPPPYIEALEVDDSIKTMPATETKDDVVHTEQERVLVAAAATDRLRHELEGW